MVTLLCAEHWLSTSIPFSVETTNALIRLNYTELHSFLVWPGCDLALENLVGFGDYVVLKSQP